MKHKNSLQKACHWPMTIEELALVISSRSYFTARRAKTESKFVSELKSAWKNKRKKDSNTSEIRIQTVLCIHKLGNMLRDGFFKGNT